MYKQGRWRISFKRIITFVFIKGTAAHICLRKVISVECFIFDYLKFIWGFSKCIFFAFSFGTSTKKANLDWKYMHRKEFFRSLLMLLSHTKLTRFWHCPFNSKIREPLCLLSKCYLFEHKKTKPKAKPFIDTKEKRSQKNLCTWLNNLKLKWLNNDNMIWCSTHIYNGVYRLAMVNGVNGIRYIHTQKVSF